MSQSPLEPLNSAQRWQAIVSQFNTALAIQQDLQRRVYEEKFDRMRDATNAVISSIQQQRQSLNQRLCECLDKLEGISESLDSTRAENENLAQSLVDTNTEREKLKCLHERLLLQEQTIADKIASDRLRLEAELEQLDKEKAELRENIKDLKGFVAMHGTLGKMDIDHSAPVITIRKRSKK